MGNLAGEMTGLLLMFITASAWALGSVALSELESRRVRVRERARRMDESIVR
jgi:hypothetical protein